jgi:L-amino acid N-acyltransferase YncA
MANLSRLAIKSIDQAFNLAEAIEVTIAQAVHKRDAITEEETVTLLKRTKALIIYSNYDEELLATTTIEEGDKKVLVMASSVTFPPDEGYYLMDGHQTYLILAVRTTKLGRTDLLYTLHARG